MDNRGLLEVYYGTGKGKTTAALGLSLRAAGQGKRVLIIQFFKKRFTGELATLQCIPRVTVFQFGTGEFISRCEPGKDDRKEFLIGWELAKREMIAARYNLIVLDELTYAFHFGILDWNDCAEVLRNHPETVEVVVTGRSAPEELLAMADLVTEMRMVKHPAGKGIGPRQGIDF
ncbi:MAG TPA: cob(I)yrinic acid a,c-diamide adenosyltransferase [Atribacteraceae bacterium]|nr:cob(I)yrinic acid a,c-diamide adenosyltransferase [Atribacteraceae bacterium]